jgi:hypothetical protein
VGLFFVIWAQQLDPKGMQQDIPFVPVKYQGESTGSESKINNIYDDVRRNGFFGLI